VPVVHSTAMAGNCDDSTPQPDPRIIAIVD